MTTEIKPPLGIMPCYIWVQRRQDEILDAINRYREVDKEIPYEWYRELNLCAEIYKMSKQGLV